MLHRKMMRSNPLADDRKGPPFAPIWRQWRVRSGRWRLANWP